MTGLVMKGSRNVFVVRSGVEFYECRIKGKVLKCEGEYYNPLAPGDIVEFTADGAGAGMITALQKRKSVFTRRNRKGDLPQILAANCDIIVCVTTISEPPFRPRFIDRILLQAEAEKVPALVVLNKIDVTDNIEDAKAARERLSDFRRIGYGVIEASAFTGEGTEELRGALAEKLAVFTGQSGVGKSCLINALFPGAELKTGALNKKYNRGTHTTVRGDLLEFGTGAGTLRIIDTPGVRQFVPCGVDASQTALYMREIAPRVTECGFGLSCTHKSEEDCAVLAAVARGEIHPDRYESLLRISEELSGVNF